MTTSYVILAVLICVLIVILVVRIARKRVAVSRQVSPENKQIYVGNLPYDVSENDLNEYFSQFGAAQSVRVIRNMKTGRSKGYAFITYGTIKEAQSALQAHGKDMQGRSMVVRIAKLRQE